jgi:hypothetical protein
MTSKSVFQHPVEAFALKLLRQGFEFQPGRNFGVGFIRCLSDKNIPNFYENKITCALEEQEKCL